MELQFANRMEGMTGNAIREILKLLQRPEVVSFAGGMPAPDSFPSKDVAKIAAEILNESGSEILQYGVTEGYPPLRETLSKWVEGKDVKASPEDILVISGSQQGIDLICKAFINKGDRVLVENPTYLAALQILRTYEADIVTVNTDEFGVELADLEKKMQESQPKLLYLVPTFQNPTGKTLPLERREKIVRLAEKYGVVVIEDDPYRDLRYQGKAISALKSFDQIGNVVYLGSFSKLISPGLRVGFAVASPVILRKMVIGKQAADVHTNNLAQAIVNQYIQEGHLEPHIEAICESYARKMNIMLETLEEVFPKEVYFTKPEGGLFIWAVLPEGIDTLELLKKAVERNVAFIPGVHFFADGSGSNTMRLNFSNSSEEKIVQGVKALAEVIKEELKNR